MRVNQTKRRNMAELCPEWYIQRWDQMGNIFVRTGVLNSRLRLWQQWISTYLTAVGLSFESARDKLSFCDFCPRTKSLSGTFDFPNNLQWKIIRVELCTMLVVASSMFFSLRSGTRTRTCPDIYRTLINFGNNSHFSLLIHSSVCWPWIDDDGHGYAGCENVYSTRIGAAAQVLISLLFYMSVIGTDWEGRQLTRNVISPLKLPFEIVFFACLGCLQRSK